jgi:hypothetical protein
MDLQPPRASKKFTGSFQDRTKAFSNWLQRFRLFPETGGRGPAFPLWVLILSLIPGLGSVVVRRSLMPLLYESLPGVLAFAGLVLVRDGSPRLLIYLALFTVMALIASLNYRRACLDCGVQPPDRRKALWVSIAYSAMFFMLSYSFGRFMGRYMIEVRYDLKPLALHDQQLIFRFPSYAGYRRGDLVLMRNTQQLGVIFGLAGDTVKIENAQVSVNGLVLDREKYRDMYQLLPLGCAAGERPAVPSGCFRVVTLGYYTGLNEVVCGAEEVHGRMIYRVN